MERTRDGESSDFAVMMEKKTHQQALSAVVTLSVSLESDGARTPALFASNIADDDLPNLSQLNIDPSMGPSAVNPSTRLLLPPAPLRHMILVPLYIYPATRQSWAPLELAARAHPELDFVAVVNLDNGPGWTAAPDANYMTAIRRLRSLPNVRLVGYIYASFGVRPVAAVWHDLCVYRGWERASGPGVHEEKEEAVGAEARVTATGQQTGAAEGTAGGKQAPPQSFLRLDGIFFDEAPSEPDYVAYMDALACLARAALDPSKPPPAPCVDEAAEAAEVARLLADREAALRPGNGDGDAVTGKIAAPGLPSSAADASPPILVIYNPGVIITDPAFFSSADYIIMFENYGSEWADMAECLDALPAEMKARSVVLGHSFAESGGVAGAKRLAGDAVRRFRLGGQFAATNYGYLEWCPGWMEYVDEVGRLVREGGETKGKEDEVTL